MKYFSSLCLVAFCGSVVLGVSSGSKPKFPDHRGEGKKLQQPNKLYTECKKIIRIIRDANKRSSCKEDFFPIVLQRAWEHVVSKVKGRKKLTAVVVGSPCGYNIAALRLLLGRRNKEGSTKYIYLKPDEQIATDEFIRELPQLSPIPSLSAAESGETKKGAGASILYFGVDVGEHLQQVASRAVSMLAKDGVAFIPSHNQLFIYKNGEGNAPELIEELPKSVHYRVDPKLFGAGRSKAPTKKSRRGRK